jgi:hypothetical protein
LVAMWSQHRLGWLCFSLRKAMSVDKNSRRFS